MIIFSEQVEMARSSIGIALRLNGKQIRKCFNRSVKSRVANICGVSFEYQQATRLQVGRTALKMFAQRYTVVFVVSPMSSKLE